MPIYEYRCTSCEQHFELLVRSSTVPQCPHCAGNQLEKQLSVFSASVPSTTVSSMAPGPCGSCGNPDGPGSCALH
jgi:putative FmdB family regulatory protein